MASTPPQVKTPTESSYILEGQQPVVDDPTIGNDTAQLLQEENGHGGDTSLVSASFNYINSIIGSGVIGIPYAFKQSGFGLGIFLLTLVAWMTDYSLILMVRSAHLSGSFTYQGIMRAAYGRIGYFILSTLQFVYPFIAMISYNVVVGDTVTKVVINWFGPDSFLAHRYLIIAVANCIVTTPLAFSNDLSKLSNFSFTSLLGVGFILCAVFIKIGDMKKIVPDDKWVLINYEVMPALAIMAFAFMCHHNTFLVYHSIKNNSQQKWNKVTHISVGTSYIATALFGIAGYATFKQLSQGDVLENYCWDDTLINFARLAFGATILLTYPIEFLVTRDVINNTFAQLSWCVEHPGTVHWVVTIFLAILIYGLSLITDCLGIVLEINGILSAVPLAYVFPAIIYLKLEEGKLFTWAKCRAIFLAAFGITCAIAGIVSITTNFRELSSCSHGIIMPYCNMTV